MNQHPFNKDAGSWPYCTICGQHRMHRNHPYSLGIVNAMLPRETPRGEHLQILVQESKWRPSDD